jgi:hypothetical protein
VVPFSVKELVVLDTLLDNGAKNSSQDNPIGLQQSIKISSKQLPQSSSSASMHVKSFPAPCDEDTVQQNKRPNTRKISSKMVASGKFTSFLN